MTAKSSAETKQLFSLLFHIPGLTDTDPYSEREFGLVFRMRTWIQVIKLNTRRLKEKSRSSSFLFSLYFSHEQNLYRIT